VCVPNAALVQINDFIGAGLTLDLSGAIRARLFIPANGFARVCLPPGSYTFSGSAPGYYTRTGTKMFEQGGDICVTWDWWPENLPQPRGTCSTIPSDYSPP
jgi:hypothetical protein